MSCTEAFYLGVRWCGSDSQIHIASYNRVPARPTVYVFAKSPLLCYAFVDKVA